MEVVASSTVILWLVCHILLGTNGLRDEHLEAITLVEDDQLHHYNGQLTIQCRALFGCKYRLLIILINSYIDYHRFLRLVSVHLSFSIGNIKAVKGKILNSA